MASGEKDSKIKVKRPCADLLFHLTMIMIFLVLTTDPYILLVPLTKLLVLVAVGHCWR